MLNIPSQKKRLAIPPETVHLWPLDLSTFYPQKHRFRDLLQPDELTRAESFHFEEHRTRFVVTRGILRTILSLYTEIPATEINFCYGPEGKPYLTKHPFEVQFNVSHSHDKALIAVTTHTEIGVDIEPITKCVDYEKIAKRYFTSVEQSALQQCEKMHRALCFYRIWSRKEALVKAMGKGIFQWISHFSVSVENDIEVVTLNHQDQHYCIHLESLSLSFFNSGVIAQYAAAFATPKIIHHILMHSFEMF